VFVPGKPLQPSLMFVGKVRSLPYSGAIEMFFYLGRLLAFLINIGQEWKGLPGTNTSLLRIFVKYGRKKFYNIGPWLKDSAFFSL
jgi:hypothetical protein